MSQSERLDFFKPIKKTALRTALVFSLITAAGVYMNKNAPKQSPIEQGLDFMSSLDPGLDPSDVKDKIPGVYGSIILSLDQLYGKDGYSIIYFSYYKPSIRSSDCYKFENNDQICMPFGDSKDTVLSYNSVDFMDSSLKKQLIEITKELEMNISRVDRVFVDVSYFYSPESDAEVNFSVGTIIDEFGTSSEVYVSVSRLGEKKVTVHHPMRSVEPKNACKVASVNDLFQFFTPGEIAKIKEVCNK